MRDGARKADGCEPLLKWPGGKRALLPQLLPLIPSSFEHYIEPFFGGGALFFAVQPNKAFLSDSNPDLINCYTQVRDHPEKVIAYLKRHKNSECDYYKIREQETKTPVSCASRLIYLTTLSFNGIHRLNLKGQFNVPYGHKTHLQPCNPVKILTISKALSSAKLRCADFEEAVKNAKRGDLIYFDPPYTVAHENNGFLKYNDKIFSWEDQIRLAGLSRSLANRGCSVIVSNADHPSIRSLYKGFRVKIVKRASVIAASDRYRRHITECIFYKGV